MLIVTQDYNIIYFIIFLCITCHLLPFFIDLYSKFLFFLLKSYDNIYQVLISFNLKFSIIFNVICNDNVTYV